MDTVVINLWKEALLQRAAGAQTQVVHYREAAKLLALDMTSKILARYLYEGIYRRRFIYKL